MNTLVETHRPAAPPARQPAEEHFLLPPTNVVETREAYVIEAEMPGVNRTGLEVTLEGNTLTLTGRRNREPLQATPLYVESKPASFRRVFEVDPAIETGKISAHLEQGLLRVHLPKAERVKPRQIAVTD